jgi:thioredoxin-dependent peroxiredoxin
MDFSDNNPMNNSVSVLKRTWLKRTWPLAHPRFQSGLAWLLLLTLWLAGHSLAIAQLKPGQAAPVFKAPAALAGETFTFDLAQALAQGPVVVYFYPKAFTSGCTIEAQMFAQASDDFKAQKTTVVGVSSDDIETLKKFSTGPCGGKFAVAADLDQSIMKDYDAALKIWPGVADRISYAIAPDGSIIDVYESLSPAEHVTRTLAAVTKWQASQR